MNTPLRFSSSPLANFIPHPSSLILLLSFFLRLWQLGQVPPGFYRDEAFYGLDAAHVLQGELALFFPANNGREPLFIYLVAGSIALFGANPWAVRLVSALVGTLTTSLVYKLNATWFGRSVGLFSAWLWAVTLWPLHLNRLGLRVSLLPLALCLAFYLLTRAYRHPTPWLWLMAGVAYAFCFYTYLAVRFTPAVLLPLLFWAWWQGKLPSSRFLAWYLVGFMVGITPFAWVIAQDPSILTGRAGQVSILHPSINNGDLWGTFVRHIGQALGMFFWQGDAIIRHNPAGRPVFDLLLLPFFALGLWFALRHIRRLPLALALLWSVVMLGPTILAEDTPHFLRAAGVLPAILTFPAIGLSQVWGWPKLLPHNRVLVGVVLVASLGLMVQTYFVTYAQDPQTGYLFEVAASNLAQQVNLEQPHTQLFMEERLWSGWPSIPFLVHTPPHLTRFESGLPPLHYPTTFFVWPHNPAGLEQIAQAAIPPVWVSATEGSWARGDLEAEAYPLFVRYHLAPPPSAPEVIANFNHQFWLHSAELSHLNPATLQLSLLWSTPLSQTIPPAITVFVHVLDTQTGQLAGQNDAPPAQGYWPSSVWQPAVYVQDEHLITLNAPFDPGRHQIWVGLYPAGEANNRLPLLDQNGLTINTAWPLPLTPP